MKTQQPAVSSSVFELATALLAAVQQQEAVRLARAIAFTRQRHRDGFMAQATMQAHVRSLFGQADWKGCRQAVDDILAKGAR